MTEACMIALVSLAICISSSFNFAYATDAAAPGAAESNKFKVVGHVYCDTCRVEFETKISQPISGAVVKLECRNRTDGAVTFQSPEITTTQSGDYRIHVEGDYEDSDCHVTLVKSSRPDCSDLTEDWRKARVVLTSLAGVSGDIRFANNLGFKKKEAVPECKKVLTELGYYELQDELGHEVVP
ncbi:Alg9-like mannosyltransferase family isoform 1 [Hibiscus syriacus]|uniref:Alg9-like mannosyltransferase family isoform 1 n=1 Tax=Hibiscus syriacus TaxID=106335 RepID=A0A6A2WCW7_HIBSY|nr:anther-specific protein LAT52-like [Hibiscus syriacus]KAE8653835.1 Alg9-like mannosyltransferase family isoform 1 [Hibiscus syriacus]